VTFDFFFHSRSDSSNDALFEFGVANDTSVGRQFDEHIRKQRNAKQGTNKGRIRQKLFQVHTANEDSNDFDKIVITRKNPSRPIKNEPSPKPPSTEVPVQAQAGSSTSSSYVMPGIPLVRKFLNSGQAAVQLVRKSIPSGARVTIDGLRMAVSTPKSNHSAKNPFEINSVTLSPIKRLLASRPKELQVRKLQRSSQKPTTSVRPIHAQQPPRDHQAQDEEGPGPVDDDVVVMSSSHSSVEIDIVDQSMSIHTPPAKAHGSRSLERMTLRKSSPQKNVTHHSNVQQGVISPSQANVRHLVNSLVDGLPDEEDAVQQEEHGKPRQVSFHRTVTVIPAEEESKEVVEPLQHNSLRIQRRRSIHEVDGVDDEYRPVSKKLAVDAKAPAQNRSSHYDTFKYEMPDSDGTDADSRSKQPPRSLEVIEEHVPSQEPEPEFASQTSPRPRTSGSSNDSVYFDTQKSARSEEVVRQETSPPPNPSAKRYTPNRPSGLIPPESPMSDGSLFMTNDCENVRQSILSQDTGRDKADDVFLVPSQPLVVKKIRRPKKSQVSS
jgi:hypothetical protein